MAESHICRGHVLGAQKRYREAMAELEIARRISPGSEDAQVLLDTLAQHI